MLILIVTIPVALVGLSVGFLLGTRYCARNMVPALLASMEPREAARTVKKAMELRGSED